MKLAEALGHRINGKDVLEIKSNGNVIWAPPVSDQLQSILDLLYPADGFFRLYQQMALGQQLLYQGSNETTPTLNPGDPIGFVRDLSGNGNNGIPPVSAARPTAFPGIFDGVDDHIVSPGSVGAGDFAMCFAIDATRLASSSVIAANYDGNTSGFILYGSSPFGSLTGRLRFWTNTDGELAIGPDLRGGGKTVISVIRIGNIYRLRVDGAQVGQSNGSTASLLRPTMFTGRRGGAEPNSISADFIAETTFGNATLQKLEAVESYFASLL